MSFEASYIIESGLVLIRIRSCLALKACKCVYNLSDSADSHLCRYCVGRILSYV